MRTSQQLPDGARGAVEALLRGAPDYWALAAEGLSPRSSLDGLLPPSRALPDCPAAAGIAAAGGSAWRSLLDVARGEGGCSLRRRNAVFLLTYFDDLFAYRELKALHAEASAAQRRYIDAASRKMLLRCLEVSEDSHGPLTREIVRNTSRGRLLTTDMVAELAARLADELGRLVHVLDIGVSDGVTTLDLAEALAARGVRASITGTDVHMYLLYAEAEGDRVVSRTDGEPLQYEIDGGIYGLRHKAVPTALAARAQHLAAGLAGERVERISTLAPQVERAMASDQFDLRFREEDAFRPDADFAEADIIRVANLLVERTDDHKGYYFRQDILNAISHWGSLARDGAYLFLDNFRKKVEHVGVWRKDGRAGQWARIPVSRDVEPDLIGVESIPIAPGHDEAP